MTVDVKKETIGFQAEIKQLLDLVVHSLYSNKEIFLRELVSNASDAADKLRFEALSDGGLYEGSAELKIHVEVDKEAGTVTVRDNGIGMTREEVIENIGTIAKSGTKGFFQKLTGDQAKDSQLIGQFGVGFYASFIVAEKVTLLTRRAGLSPEHGVRWESNGEGEYVIENIERSARGTEVILHLREEEKEFAEEFRLRSIIKKYSDHIAFPIVMPSIKEDKEKNETTITDEVVNNTTAIWVRPKSEIKEEEYNEFYKHVAHDFEEPLLTMHNKVEGNLEYTSLLFIPKRAPFDLWDRNQRKGVKLYVRRIFIMDDAEQLLPPYLRFIRGIIDSNDLPLNISREILQQHKQIDAIRNGTVKKVLGMLETMAKDEREKYQKFWKEFGRVLKEGIADDYANREKIAKLLKFSSTHDNTAEPSVGLDDYVQRMKEGQDKIYYITAENFSAACHSPHLEIFRKKGIEVLLLCEPIDEWLVSHLHEFEGKSLQSITKGKLDLGKLEDEAEQKQVEQAQETLKPFLDKMKDSLQNKVKEVRASYRLTESPACLVADEYAMDANLERMLRAAGQNLPHTPRILEINPDHPLVQMVQREENQEMFTNWAHLLFEQAALSEGGQLDDPMEFVRRMNQMFMALKGDAPRIILP